MLVPAHAERAGAASVHHGAAVRSMFDRISPTYDLLNRVLSWGIDRRWRVKALDRLSESLADGPLLDVCAGTLDLSAAMQERFAGRALIAGDFAREMLVRGVAKLSRPATLAVCDAMQLPLANESIGGAVCGFGMRNLADVDRGIAEAHRVLKPGGSIVVLEFFRPTRIATRAFHGFYGSFLLPLVGRWVSGDAAAYRYLSKSMKGFVTRGEFEDRMRAAGFGEVVSEDLTLGIASIVRGVK